jgi:DNA-directed RNA polymerase sigma subunit (sigma70/sigma32)
MDRKLTPDKVIEIRRLRAVARPTLKELGDAFGVSREAVRRICDGTLWRSVPLHEDERARALRAWREQERRTA